MKAEHRKELQTNLLADRMGRLVQNLKSGPKSSRSVLVWVALLLVAGAIVAGWLIWDASRKSQSALWAKLSAASDVQELGKLAKENQGTVAAQVARTWEARVLLAQGLQDLYAPRQREEALKKIKEAQILYDKLVDETKDVPVLAQEALLGAARSRESLGDLDGANGLYKKLVERYRDSARGKEAQEMLDQQKEREQFYARMMKELDAAAQSPPLEKQPPEPLPPLPPLTPIIPPPEK